jgi:asparagine synthetase B (glutamine-hydrolysing)
MDEDTTTPTQFLDILTSALSIRTQTIPQTHTHTSDDTTAIATSPRVAILFSGGLDCSVLAWLIHTLLPPNEPIDLINVVFENPRTISAQKTQPEDIYNVCPDRITGRAGWEELRQLSQGTHRIWNFIEIDIPYQETVTKKDDIIKLMYPNNSSTLPSVLM